MTGDVLYTGRLKTLRCCNWRFLRAVACQTPTLAYRCTFSSRPKHGNKDAAFAAENSSCWTVLQNHHPNYSPSSHTYATETVNLLRSTCLSQYNSILLTFFLQQAVTPPQRHTVTFCRLRTPSVHTKRYASFIHYGMLRYRRGIKRCFCLTSDVCLSRISGITREQRGL